MMALTPEGNNITYAECSSLLREGHMVAALSGFSKQYLLPKPTPTDKLQEWNQPRRRHLDPIPVE